MVLDVVVGAILAPELLLDDLLFLFDADGAAEVEEIVEVEEVGV